MENKELCQKKLEGIKLYNKGLKEFLDGTKLLDGSQLRRAKQEFRSAIINFKKAAELDNSNSLKKLGDIYRNGLPNNINIDGDIMINYSLSREYYVKAADLGNSDAMYYLGNLNKNERKWSNAIQYYARAADLGNSDAEVKLRDFADSDLQFRIGKLYHQGLGVVRQDYEKAREYYEKSVQENNSNAIYNLGELYRNGFGVERDTCRALKYYEKSNLLGNNVAKNRLGWLYHRGLEVKQDYVKARNYFEEAARLNDRNAINSIGCLYYREKNWEIAQNYFLDAKKLGNDIAACNYFVLLYYKFFNSKFTPSQQECDDSIIQKSNYEKAKEFLYNAAINGEYDEIADNNILLYIIERVKSDYSKDQLQSQAHLIAKLQAQYQQQLITTHQTLHQQLHKQTQFPIALQLLSRIQLEQSRKQLKLQLEQSRKQLKLQSQLQAQLQARYTLLEQLKVHIQEESQKEFQKQSQEQFQDQFQEQFQVKEKLLKQLQEQFQNKYLIVQSQEQLQVQSQLLAQLLGKPQEQLLEQLQGQLQEQPEQLQGQLQEQPEQVSILCPVCKVNRINRVMSCGHTICDVCYDLRRPSGNSEEPMVKRCPICAIPAPIANPLFLNGGYKKKYLKYKKKYINLKN
jgi:TPR repeat protein